MLVAAAKTVKTGDNVSINYILTSTNGTVLDTSYADVARAARYEMSEDYQAFPLPVRLPGNGYQGVSEAVIDMKAGSQECDYRPGQGLRRLRPDTYPGGKHERTYGSRNITPYVNQTLTTLFGRVTR